MADQQPELPNWLKPLPVRIAVVVAPVLWSIFEFWNGQTLWGASFLAVAVWGFNTMIWSRRDQ
jgi:hypothetical protein